MSVAVEIKVEGLEKPQRAVQRLLQLGLSPRPLWKAFGQYGETSTRLRFKNQAGPDGTPWKVSKRVRKQGGQTLVLKARLLRSITHNATNSGTEWGSNVVYARIHQLGGKINKLAFSSTLRLRTTASGALLRQKDHAHLSVFAKATHKRAVERRYTVGAHTITMPARLFLGVNAEDVREMRRIGGGVVGEVIRGGGL